MKTGSIIAKLRIFRSLRAQLILFYTIISFIVISVGYYFSYTYSMDLIKRYNEKFLIEQFHQFEYNIKSAMNEVDKLSILFIMDSNVQGFLEKNYGNEEISAVENHKSILDRITSFTNNYKYINSIYLLTDNGREIGGSSSRSVIKTSKDNNALFLSEIVKNALKTTPKFYWSGGKDTSFFNPGVKFDQQEFLLSASRLIKPNYQPKTSATLIFNVNERYLASLYANTNIQNGYIYIVNEQGIIISSADGKNIGKASSVDEYIRGNKTYGTFTSLNAGKQIQIVYYKLSDMNWLLVREIPYKLLEVDVVALQRTVLIIFIASMLLIFLISFFSLKKMIRPLNALASKMYDMGSGKLGITFSKIPKNEFGIVIKRFNDMSVNIKELVDKNTKMQEEKQRLEIEALQYQINPHFIYNTLSTIKWMAAMINARNIVDSINALGNIIQPVFRSVDSMCTVKEETEYIYNYLKIMNIRFGNLINFEINIPESVIDCRIPRFILQPVIENSVAHGMVDDNLLNIVISVSEVSGLLNISVSDDGLGISVEGLAVINEMLELSKKHEKADNLKIGLYNVSRRICLNFGSEYGIKLESEKGRGTVVYISIPAMRLKN